jgi:hypothetical protein
MSKFNEAPLISKILKNIQEKFNLKPYQIERDGFRLNFFQTGKNITGMFAKVENNQLTCMFIPKELKDELECEFDKQYKEIVVPAYQKFIGA